MKLYKESENLIINDSAPTEEQTKESFLSSYLKQIHTYSRYKW